MSCVQVQAAFSLDPAAPVFQSCVRGQAKAILNLAHPASGVLCALQVQIDVSVVPGTHSTDAAVSKQLQDRERVAAALENPNLMDMVNKCLARSEAALH